MKSLLILRHAKSSWGNAYLADHQRPLNERGKHDAPRMGRLLQTEDLTPDLIISSSAERALQTAELVALHADYANEIMVTRAFYHADPETYLEVLAEVAAEKERVMVVGHNPGLEELVEMLCGVYERMPTAALAYLTLDVNHWAELNEETAVTLQQVWRPKELDI